MAVACEPCACREEWCGWSGSGGGCDGRPRRAARPLRRSVGGAVVLVVVVVPLPHPSTLPPEYPPAPTLALVDAGHSALSSPAVLYADVEKDAVERGRGPPDPGPPEPVEAWGSKGRRPCEGYG